MSKFQKWTTGFFIAAAVAITQVPSPAQAGPEDVGAIFKSCDRHNRKPQVPALDCKQLILDRLRR